GDAGAPGQNGCNGAPSGQSRGLVATISVTSPGNGQFFAAGEQPALTITLVDRCGLAIRPSELGSAQLYLVGPQVGLQARAACTLLGCSTDRAVKDHHRINLKTVSPNTAPIPCPLAAITTEAPGTYIAAVSAESTDK